MKEKRFYCNVVEFGGVVVHDGSRFSLRKWDKDPLDPDSEISWEMREKDERGFSWDFDKKPSWRELLEILRD